MAYTQTELYTAVQQFAENDETTFVANIPNFVEATEELIFKRIQLLLFKKNATGTLTASNRFFAQPTDYLAPIHMTITDGSSVRTVLDFKDVDYLNLVYPNATTEGLPRWYASYDTDYFIVAPTPDSGYTVELTYYYRPTSLTAGAGSGTTWLSTNAPHAMLYGTLMHAYIYMKGEQDILQAYTMQFNEAMKGLKQLGEAKEVTDEYRQGRQRIPRS